MYNFGFSISNNLPTIPFQFVCVWSVILWELTPTFTSLILLSTQMVMRCLPGESCAVRSYSCGVARLFCEPVFLSSTHTVVCQWQRSRKRVMCLLFHEEGISTSF